MACPGNPEPQAQTFECGMDYPDKPGNDSESKPGNDSERMGYASVK